MFSFSFSHPLSLSLSLTLSLSQEVHLELRSQKVVLQRIMESLRMKYSDMYTLVPVDIEGPLQEVSSSLQEVEEQVEY